MQKQNKNQILTTTQSSDAESKNIADIINRLRGCAYDPAATLDQIKAERLARQ